MNTNQNKSIARTIGVVAVFLGIAALLVALFNTGQSGNYIIGFVFVVVGLAMLFFSRRSG